jgi:NRAMP (natural resistance-associated macrophage protein)-like metal ion transporter
LPSSRPLANRCTKSADSGEPRVDPKRPRDPNVTELQLERNPLKRFVRVLGPGLITGASDDDPSGIGTYAQTGARYGYQFLWTTILMLPMMISVQYICAKIGLVSGRGLAAVFKQRYPGQVVYPVVLAMVIANTVNAGADIGAIGAALNILVPIPAVLFVVPVGIAIALIQVLGSYQLISRIFKWLALALLAYVGAALFSHPDMGAVLAGSLIPKINVDAASIGILVALLGTTISPYLFFWQTSQEVEEQKNMGRRRLWQRQGASKAELKFALWDTVAGMAFSEIVAFFIILATGATLFVSGKTDIQSATDAAQALRPVAGDASALLLAIGLIGAGILAVPILTTSAAFGVADALGWKSSLDAKPREAKRFYAVIVAATLVGIAINFLGINPIQALVVTAILNGLLAPPVLILVMLASNDRAIMGERTNGRLLNIVGWATTLVMAAAAIALVVVTLLPS